MQQLHIPFREIQSADLTSQQQALATAAEQAMKLAHAPYSQFTVGSAVLLTDGTVYAGSNQENAAYPSGLCAERVALFKARSETKTPMQVLVVLAENAKGELADAFSCGGCRQVLMECASQQTEPIQILMRTKTGTFILLDDVRLLMPFSFEKGSLG